MTVFQNCWSQLLDIIIDMMYMYLHGRKQLKYKWKANIGNIYIYIYIILVISYYWRIYQKIVCSVAPTALVARVQILLRPTCMLKIYYIILQ